MRAMVLNGTKMSCYDQIKVRGMQHIMTQRDVIYCHQNSTVLHSLVKDISDVVLLLRSTILYFTALYCYSISIVTLSLAPPLFPSLIHHHKHTCAHPLPHSRIPSIAPPLLYLSLSITRLYTHSPHAHVCTHTHTRTYTHTYTPIHTHLLSHIHTLIFSHTYTHTFTVTFTGHDCEESSYPLRPAHTVLRCLRCWVLHGMHCSSF